MSPDVGGHWVIDNPNGRSAAYRSLETNTTHAHEPALRLRDAGALAGLPRPRAGARVVRGVRRRVRVPRADPAAQRGGVGAAARVRRLARGGARARRHRSREPATTRSSRARATTGSRACPRSRASSRASRSTRSATAIPTRPIAMRGKRVAVVGIGNTGCELACEIARGGRRGGVPVRAQRHVDHAQARRRPARGRVGADDAAVFDPVPAPLRALPRARARVAVRGAWPRA